MAAKPLGSTPTLAELRRLLNSALVTSKREGEVWRWLESSLPALLEAQQDAKRLDAIRRTCKVVYYPPEVGAYPIEHAPIAGKDSWSTLMRTFDAKDSPPDATPQTAK